MGLEPEDQRHCGHIFELPRRSAKECLGCGLTWSHAISHRRQCETEFVALTEVHGAISPRLVSAACMPAAVTATPVCLATGAVP